MRETPIGPRDSGGALHDRLAALGAEAIVAAIAQWQAGRLEAAPQPADGAHLRGQDRARTRRASTGPSPPPRSTGRCGPSIPGRWPRRAGRAGNCASGRPSPWPGARLAALRPARWSRLRGGRIVVATGDGALRLTAGAARRAARDDGGRIPERPRRSPGRGSGERPEHRRRRRSAPRRRASSPRSLTRRPLARRPARGRRRRRLGARAEALARATARCAGTSGSTPSCGVSRTARPRSCRRGLRALLEVGLFQLLSGETAAHAAVAETVNAARVLGHARAAGFVNAVLRRFQRERRRAARARSTPTPPCAPRTRAGWSRRCCASGRTTRVAILEANNEHPPMWLRVNRTRWTVAECAAALAGGGLAGRAPMRSRRTRCASSRRPTCARCPGSPTGGCRCRTPPRSSRSTARRRSAGERMLDACAAPGGKTCHVLERVAGRCDLTALDVVRGAARAGAGQPGPPRPAGATCVAGDAGEPGGLVGRPAVRPHPARRALLGHRRDPPPPGHQAAAPGRRHPGAGAAPGPAARAPPGACSRPGGTLLYASCSVLRAENEAVVGGFLAAHPGGDRPDRRKLTRGWPARPAGRVRATWSLPGEAGMDGFYYACLHQAPMMLVMSNSSPVPCGKGREVCGLRGVWLLCFLATLAMPAAADTRLEVSRPTSTLDDGVYELNARARPRAARGCARARSRPASRCDWSTRSRSRASGATCPTRTWPRWCRASS